MTPARLYLLVSGGYLLVVGVVGFGLDASFPTSSAEVAASHGHLFGIFETNGWHNLGAVGLGLSALVVAIGRPGHSAVVAVLSGAANAGVFLLFAGWEPATFLVASNAADQVVHATLAVGGLTVGGWDLLAARGRLGGRARKTFLVVHILSGAMWFGIDLGLGILTITAMLTDDPRTAGIALLAVQLFAIWPMFGASLVCLGAGVVLAVGGKYGLLRYWWVAVKFGVNLLMSTLIVASLRPGVDEVASIGERLIAGDTTASVPSDLLFPVLVAPALLLTAYLLSVFKPWGRIRRTPATVPSEQYEDNRALIEA